MRNLALVYLLANREEPVRRFFDAYRAHPAGVEHDLVLIANRWTGNIESWMRRLAEDGRASLLEVGETRFDIDAYRAAACRLRHRHVCFVNSYSEPLVEGWLALLFAQATRSEVGAVSASGSWESHFTSYFRAIPSAVKSPETSLKRSIRGALTAARLRIEYGSFPNAHIRTNAFAMERDLFIELAPRRIRSKARAEGFESGRGGLSRMLERMGRPIVVAGRDGLAYSPADFRESHTFRIGNQCNLIVRDNRTAQYATADDSNRKAFREMAWGDSSDIRCPRCAAASGEVDGRPRVSV